MYMLIPKDVMHFYCDKCRGRVPVPGLRQAERAESMACLDCGRRQNINALILKVVRFVFVMVVKLHAATIP
jgi:hypothetical protein